MLCWSSRATAWRRLQSCGGSTKCWRSKCIQTRTERTVCACVGFNAASRNSLVKRTTSCIAGAADAFKRLSEAYECLVDEPMQRHYLSALTRPTATHKPPPPPQQPPFPTKQRTKKKRKPPPPPPQPPVAETPRRWRTPEEIWEQFQREEEEQAKRDFMVRGFDRDYEPPPPPHRKRAVPVADADQEADPMAAQGVETRARGWTQWKRSRTTVDSPTPSPPQAAATANPGEEIMCCLLCRRKFPTPAALARHEQLSALHKENVARQAVEMASGDQVS
jgi:hypothetical protein